MSNMSNGKENGFVLSYVMDEVAYPVVLDKETMQMLEVLIPMAFTNKEVQIVKENPMGSVSNLHNNKFVRTV